MTEITQPRYLVLSNCDNNFRTIAPTEKEAFAIAEKKAVAGVTLSVYALLAEVTVETNPRVVVYKTLRVD